MTRGLVKIQEACFGGDRTIERNDICAAIVRQILQQALVRDSRRLK